MARQKEVHVVSHTHRDREWYLTFQQYRMRLVDVIDQVLDLLENNPGYKYFTLDGQTVVLEDYFEIKPENRERVEKLVKAGKRYPRKRIGASGQHHICFVRLHKIITKTNSIIACCAGSGK